MRINPVKALVELFLPPDPSPLKALPINHPTKRYCYTLVGFNNKPLTAISLGRLGFIGQVKNSSDHVILENEMLFADLNMVVQIAMLYNIARIRKYHDSGHGIQWESSAKDVYRKLIDAQLFTT